MSKDEILKIIDEVMNNREIDSIRNAILAIRDKVIEIEDEDKAIIVECDMDHIYKIPLFGNEPGFTNYYFEGAKYICIDPSEKIDTGIYGALWYE